MKKYLPIAAAAAAALALAGCAASEGEADPGVSPTGSAGADADAAAAEAAATVDAIEWDEDSDGVPTLTLDTPSTLSAAATRSVNPGDGAQIVDGNIVKVHYTVTSGTDGSQAFSTYDNDAPEMIPVNSSSLDPSLYDTLTSASVGEDIIFATLDQSVQDNPNAAIYMAMTIVDVTAPLDRADGTAVEPEEGLPAVTLDDAGKPSVEIGDAEKPTELVVQPLIEGDGQELALGDNVVAHYSGWLWDGEQFDSSWERGDSTIFPFTEGGLIKGWTDGLAGHKVGSQVLLVIPPELAYGAEGNASVPGDATLVFVVDILGIIPTE